MAAVAYRCRIEGAAGDRFERRRVLRTWPSLPSCWEFVIERKTKIVATLGPSSSTAEAIRALVEAGMDVARLNFSHGDHETHRALAERVRRAARRSGRTVALLQDIQGPKIRVGTFPGGACCLVSGQEVRLRVGNGPSLEGEIPIGYDRLLEDIREGHQIYLADGLIRLVSRGAEAGELRAEVTLGGELGDRKGVAFPDSKLEVSAVTAKDEADLAFGRELGVDYVAASFVQSRADVERVKARVAEGVQVIAKVELAVAYERLDELLEVAEGIMVARGDLGVQLPLERIPLIQQDILERTNAAGRISITATEMLESMTQSPRPTRAEVTDVASAVQTGTDAVMLSGETAAGRHPVRAVEVMGIICAAIEAGGRAAGPAPDVDFLAQSKPFPSAAARAAVQSSAALGIDTIVAFTESGDTARLISKYRPNARIVAFTPSRETQCRMALLWGVQARVFPRMTSTDEMIASAERRLVREGICRAGDGVVMVAGVPPGQRASTNLIKLHIVGAEPDLPEAVAGETMAFNSVGST